MIKYVSEENYRRMCLTDPEMHRFKLSESQREMVLRCDEEFDFYFSSAQAADLLDITIQSASTRLKRLYELGYMERSATIQESGGQEYIYCTQWTHKADMRNARNYRGG